MEQRDTPVTDTEHPTPAAVDAARHAPAPIVDAAGDDDQEEEFLILNAYALLRP
jgi:hypothetical protein